MSDSLLLGLWKYLVRIPPAIWKCQAARGAEHDRESITFMTPDHHRVRDFAVLELPRRGRPIPPDEFARELGIPCERVVSILDELERNLTFVFRNAKGEVTWAYPVTVEPTPHRVHFDSGETVYAA